MPRFPKPQKLAVPVKPPKGHFFFAGHTIERVKWWTSGPMRKLYFLLVVMIMVIQLPKSTPNIPQPPPNVPQHPQTLLTLANRLIRPTVLMEA